MISCIRRNFIVHVSGIVARGFLWYLKLSIWQEEASIGPKIQSRPRYLVGKVNIFGASKLRLLHPRSCPDDVHLGWPQAP